MPNTDRRARLSRFPWKALATNLGTIGAAHALGYMASGATSNLLARTPVVQNQWNRLSPRQQHGIATVGIGLAGSLIPVARIGLTVASQANMAEAYERAHRDEAATEEGEKAAHVLEVYRLALEQL